MRAVTIPEPGTAHVLTVAEVPDPAPAPGEVLLDVAAAGVNRADLLQRSGHYPPPAGASPLPGLEVSGVVAAVGPVDPGVGPSPWRVGDRVAALLTGGGYAQRVAVPAGQVLPVPDGIDLVDAAALPEALCTVWANLVVDAPRPPAPGSWLLVHGGSGGVGSAAVQIGAALGMRVITTAGGRTRGQRCVELGADVAVDHRTEDFTAVAKDVTGGAGVDVILDVMGGAYLGDNVRALATGGRLAVIGLQGGRRGELDLGLLLTRRAHVHGSTLRARPAVEKAAIVAAVREHVWPWLGDGRVRPVVHARLPLDEAREAHEMLDSGDVFGKVLLLP